MQIVVKFCTCLKWFLLAHSVLKVAFVLVVVEISDHLESPRFDLLLFDHLLKHEGREILLDALGATLEL